MIECVSALVTLVIVIIRSAKIKISMINGEALVPEPSAQDPDEPLEPRTIDGEIDDINEQLEGIRQEIVGVRNEVGKLNQRGGVN